MALEPPSKYPSLSRGVMLSKTVPGGLAPGGLGRVQHDLHIDAPISGRAAPRSQLVKECLIKLAHVIFQASVQRRAGAGSSIDRRRQCRSPWASPIDPKARVVVPVLLEKIQVRGEVGDIGGVLHVPLGVRAGQVDRLPRPIREIARIGRVDPQRAGRRRGSQSRHCKKQDCGH